MTNYEDGRRFEWATRDALRADGYDVLRTAGSKSKVDLVGIKAGQLLLVQCKRSGVCPPAERAALVELAAAVDALPIVAWKPTRGVIGYRRLLSATVGHHADWTPDEVTA